MSYQKADQQLLEDTGMDKNISYRFLVTALLAAMVLLGSVGGVHAQVLVANDDTYVVPFGQSLNVDAFGVLDNDTLDGEPAGENGATAELVNDVSFGVLVLNADGSFSYTPNPDFPGIDTFTYQAVFNTVFSQTTVTLTACSGGPTVYTCWKEMPFLEKLGQLGYSTFQEGFENNAAWGSLRVPNTATSVSSQGITWASNHPATNQITTGSGPARTGGWGVYDPDHGFATGSPTECDINTPPEQCLFKDGFTGLREAGESTLYGVGGYFTGAAQPNLILILDGTTQIGLGRLSVGGLHFLGVIDTNGFTTFRVEETDGKLGQARLVFGDDFTFGTTGPDSTPPQVTRVDTVGGELTEGASTSEAIDLLKVTFNEPVQDSTLDNNPHDVTNTDNYLLFSDGGDGFDTLDCTAGVGAGDTAIFIDAVSYLTGSELAATLVINGGLALPAGSYRLMVCGTTSVRDWAGNSLDGDGNGTGGDDFVRNFTVTTAPVNKPPTAVNDAYTTDEDAVLTEAAPGVLGNDSDVDGDSLTATLNTGPANGSLTLNADGSFTYSPDLNFNGSDSFNYLANDGKGGTNTAFVSITVSPVNDAPMFISTPVISATEDQAYIYNITAADDDLGDTLTLAAQTLPSWLTFVDNGNGTATLTGTPGNAEVGTHNVALVVTDLAATTDTQNFTIDVSNVNDTPIVTNPIPNQGAIENTAFSFQFAADTFSDPDIGDTLTYTATLSDTNPLPIWLGFNSSIRTFSGTPGTGDVGIITIRVTATDNGTPSASVYDDFILEVITNASASINLKKGFNLIAIPADVASQPDLRDWLPTLGSSIEIVKVMAFDTVSGKYITLIPEDPLNPSFTLQGGEGLVVYAKQDKEVAFTSLLCSTFDLKQGFNLVGIACPPENFTAFQLLNALGGANVTSVQRYSTEKGMFETAGFGPGINPSGFDFPIVVGEGYFIYMKQGVLNFSF